MEKTTPSQSQIPDYLKNSKNIKRVVELTNDMSGAWTEALDKTFYRIANKPVISNTGDLYRFLTNDLIEIISEETVFCQVLDTNKNLMLIVSLDWKLIGAISQASLGANTYCESISGQNRGVFEKSFSSLVSKAAASAIADVLTAKTAEAFQVLDVESGSISLQTRKNLHKFLVAAPISVNILDKNFLVRILIFDGQFEYLSGKKRIPSKDEHDNTSRTRIMSGLSQTYITVKAILKREGFNLSDLAALKTGHILRLGAENTNSTLIRIEGNDFGFCTLGKDRDTLTLRIDKRL